MKRPALGTVLLFTAIFTVCAFAEDEDPYLAYLKSAPEFKPVKQDPAGWVSRWDTWIYMPWRFKWGVGTGDEGGQFCKDYGFNGGFTDHGDASVLPWLDKWNLKFYDDHTADKGWLHLGTGDFKPHMRNPKAIRTGYKGPAPLDNAMLEKLKKITTDNVNALKKSPSRAAYSLDDEISNGSFVKPIAWRMNDDDKAYEKWLGTYYGKNPPAAQYVSPDYCLNQYGRALKDLDFSPLLDRVTYNDSVWANFLGDLVDASNAADPDCPCGFVGGQSPNTWGGYDYAKLCKKIQFIEAYLGTAQSIIRSFNPNIPQVTTHFHNDKLGTVNDFWQMWWCLAHGNRGMIGWVDGWFDGKTPRKWLEEWKGPNKELCTVQGPKVVGGKWIHDKIAIYYSQASIQCSWCLDIEPHGKTWTNRGSDDANGTWPLVRKAWEYILADSGLQYNWVSYDQVAVNGIPKEFKVLILPSCYALSDIEAKRIKEFCEAGGTVIADFACGIFDQHGKGRSKGALDDLFGVTHDGSETKKDFFGGTLWVETDQDSGFNGGVKKLLSTTKPKLEDDYAIAETKLKTKNVKKNGTGSAVYLNLSPMRYLLYRDEKSATDARREVFTKAITDAGVKPWVNITAGGKRPVNCEATYFSKGGRTLVFIVQNASVSSTSLGDTKTEGLGSNKLTVDVEFPGAVKDVVDERAGKKLGDGNKFQIEFNTAEAALLSFEGAPPVK
jgi:hypothetical protein